MQTTPVAARPIANDAVRRWLIAATIGLLAVSNVMSNRVLPAPWYVPWNVTIAVAIVALALGPGRRRPVELGLARHDARSGLRWGLALAGAVVVVYALALALPFTRGLFHDRRVGHVAASTMLFATLVRIPIGTVLLEELAFRAVLPGLLAPRLGRWRAAAAASILFGLWHVLPAWHLNTVNPVASASLAGAAGQGIVISLGVVGTALAGLFFCWLRFRSRSVLAPAIVHLATNSLGYLVAWWVLRR